MRGRRPVARSICAVGRRSSAAPGDRGRSSPAAARPACGVRARAAGRPTTPAPRRRLRTRALLAAAAAGRDRVAASAATSTAVTACRRPAPAPQRHRLGAQAPGRRRSRRCSRRGCGPARPSARRRRRIARGRMGDSARAANAAASSAAEAIGGGGVQGGGCRVGPRFCASTQRAALCCIHLLGSCAPMATDNAAPGTRHIRLTSHPGQAPAARRLSTGRGRRARTRPGGRQHHQPQPAQRRSVRTAAATASTARWRWRPATSSGAPRRPHQHRAHGSDRPIRTMGRRGEDRLHRPLGRLGCRRYCRLPEAGYDIRPTIAVTKAHIHLPEIRQALAFQRLQVDGTCCSRTARPPSPRSPSSRWVAAGRGEALRGQRGGAAPRALRGDRRHVPRARHAQRPRVFLPPIGGQTLYVFGNVRDLADPRRDADRARARRVQRLRTSSAPTSAPAGPT